MSLVTIPPCDPADLRVSLRANPDRVVVDEDTTSVEQLDALAQLINMANAVAAPKRTGVVVEPPARPATKPADERKRLKSPAGEGECETVSATGDDTGAVVFAGHLPATDSRFV